MIEDLYCGKNCGRIKEDRKHSQLYFCYAKTSSGDCVHPGEKCIYTFTTASGIEDRIAPSQTAAESSTSLSLSLSLLVRESRLDAGELEETPLGTRETHIKGGPNKGKWEREHKRY